MRYSVACELHCFSRALDLARLTCQRRFLLEKEAMNILSLVLIVPDDASLLHHAPFLDDLPCQERNLRSYKIIEKEIDRSGPGAFAAGTDVMDKEIRHLRKSGDEGLGPDMPQAAPNQRTRESVEQRIAA